MTSKITLKDFKLACKNGLRALHFDTETSPLLAYLFQIGSNISVSHKQIKQGSGIKVISIQYKWEGDKKTKFLVWDWQGNTKGGNDESMLREFVDNVLSKADLILGQNTDGFDFKVLNDRLCQLRLPTLSDIPSLDILKMSRKSFRMPSHKLDFRSNRYGLGGKHGMEMQDWIDVVEGHVPAEKKMVPYGCKDVDDEQRIMYREFDYYRNLPVKVQKTIRKFLPIEREARAFRPHCLDCKKAKKQKFDLQHLGHKIKSCNNCGGKNLKLEG